MLEHICTYTTEAILIKATLIRHNSTSCCWCLMYTDREVVYIPSNPLLVLYVVHTCPPNGRLQCNLWVITKHRWCALPLPFSLARTLKVRMYSICYVLYTQYVHVVSAHHVTFNNEWKSTHKCLFCTLQWIECNTAYLPSIKVTGYRRPYTFSVHNEIHFVVPRNLIMTSACKRHAATALCK